MKLFDAAHPSIFRTMKAPEWMIVDTFRHFAAVNERKEKRANRKTCDKMLVSVCCTINAFNLFEFIHRTPLDLHKCFSLLFCRGNFLCRLGIHHELLICHLTRVWNGKMNIWFAINWIMTVGFAMQNQFLYYCRVWFWEIWWNVVEIFSFVVRNPIIISIDPLAFECTISLVNPQTIFYLSLDFWCCKKSDIEKRQRMRWSKKMSEKL